MGPVNHNPDRLYELVPVIYRLRDAGQGYPLRALLRIIAEQVTLVEADIAGLYENWFIETCQDWVVPYIGSLVGYRTVHEAGEPSSDTAARNRILFPRAGVANTVRFRRRKGTLSAIEELAATVSGWPARAIEWQRLLGIAQNINFRHMNRGRTLDIRDGDALEDIGGSFDESTHTVDVRGGDIGDIKLFLWRLESFPVTRTAAFCFEEEGPHCFLFSALGNDTQLFTRPAPANGKPLEKLNLPIPISHSSFEHFEAVETEGARPGVPYFYGVDRSLAIWVGADLVPVDHIVPADLSDWSYRPLPNTVAVDPVLGRFAFPPTQARKQGVWVSYSYGFAAAIGGGEYMRAISQPLGAVIYTVGSKAEFHRIGDALATWQAQAPKDAVIEIVESAVFVEPLEIALKAGQTLQLRAANGVRPILRMLDWQTSATDNLSVSGEAGSWFSLDGILLTGRGLQIDGEMAGVSIKHSTLVPGWGLDCDCNPKRPGEPGIVAGGGLSCLSIRHSIVGALEINLDEVETDPLTIMISDSIVDSTDPSRVAIGAPERLCAHANLTVVRTTVFGAIQVHGIDLAENSILLGVVLACRRQQGCVRFCYVSPGSKTPRRFECQPDLVEQAVRDQFLKGVLTAFRRDALIAAERLRVQPDFNSVRYGNPAYCQLADSCAVEIRAGASDESEMGVFHDLFQPQRIANLRARLGEFTTAGADAGIFFAT